MLARCVVAWGVLVRRELFGRLASRRLLRRRRWRRSLLARGALVGDLTVREVVDRRSRLDRGRLDRGRLRLDLRLRLRLGLRLRVLLRLRLGLGRVSGMVLVAVVGAAEQLVDRAAEEVACLVMRRRVVVRRLLAGNGLRRDGMLIGLRGPFSALAGRLNRVSRRGPARCRVSVRRPAVVLGSGRRLAVRRGGGLAVDGCWLTGAFVVGRAFGELLRPIGLRPAGLDRCGRVAVRRNRTARNLIVG